MKKLMVLVVMIMIFASANLAIADEAWFEDQFILITADGAIVCYENELVEAILGNEIDTWNAYFVDGEQLVPCEVLKLDDGIYIRLFSFEDYNATQEIWRCTWC